VTAEKCFIVWNETTAAATSGGATASEHSAATTQWDDSDDAATTTLQRQACPHGWTYDRQPIQTSIVTDVSVAGFT